MANLLQLLGFPSSTTSASTSGSILGTPTTPNPELTNPNAGLLQYPSAVGSNAGSGPGNPGGNNLYGGTTNYGGLSATQAVAPGTYSKPQNALPASSFPTASYSDLVNNNGTIYNTKTGKGYSNPPELAADLGIPVQNIQWNQIAQGSVPNSNPLNIPATGSIGNIAGDNQTFANSIPISGNQKTATNLSNGSPVYTLADGNSYTQGTNGQPILATRPGDNVDVTPGTSFGGNSISPTTNSSTLGTNPSTGQVNGALQTNQDNETTLFSNLNNLFTQEQNSQAAIQQYGQVGSQEQAAQGQVAQRKPKKRF